MTQFEIDLKVPMNIQGNTSTLAYYNLVVTKRNLHLYCVGMKPNKDFKISDVKKYFSLKGNKNDIYTTIKEWVERYKLGEFDEQIKN